MNLEIFKKFIQNTPLLEEDEKAYYLSRAEVYSEEIKEEMISVISTQEHKLLGVINVKNIEAKKEALKLMNKKLKAVEKEHEAEILEAEVLLEKELSAIS